MLFFSQFAQTFKYQFNLPPMNKLITVDNKIQHHQFYMEITITQPSIMNQSRSNASKTKKVCLIKLLKKQHPHRVQTQTGSQDIQPQTINLKTQRSSNNELNQTHHRRLSELRVKTDIHHPERKKNIFHNQYLECLRSGYVNPNQQVHRITYQRKEENNEFKGPVYYSERSPQIAENPEREIPTFQEKEQIYKFDKNPRLIKFKVSLKRNNLNATNQSNLKTQSASPDQKSISRILITQLKTQQSERNRSQTNLQSITKFLPKKLSSNDSLNQTINNATSLNDRSKTSHIPKLSQNSNLFKSIKIFQRKQSLLSQIESKKGIQQKYGKRILQYVVRDRFQENQKKNEFVLKSKSQNEEKQTKIIHKNKFINDIEQGKYDTKFKYQPRQIQFKLKGKRQSIRNLDSRTLDD